MVNPWAGRRREVAERARRALQDQAVEADLVIPEGPAEVATGVRAGIEAGRRRFMAVGGDGTVNLVVDALLRHPWPEPPVLAILPAGSGSDLLRTFAIPQQMERAAVHLRGEQTYLADVGVLEGAWGRRHFLNVAQAGIGAATVETAERLPRRLGARRYLLSFWMTLPGFRRTEIELQAGARAYRGAATNVVLANAQYFGGGMNIAPRANLVDGRLDIQIFTGPKREAVTLIPRIRRGLHLTHPSVRRLSAEEFTLRSDRPWPVEADGEPVGETPLSGRVLAGAIRLKI
ncbi:MAG: diacylglycerol/lipid kinase family protein [Acidimicrobiia bacterium]